MTMDTPDTTRTGRGAVTRWRQTLIPTTREAPADATARSHQLLIRAGMIRQVTAGVYDYLPLAWRTLRKIQQIVREEMDAAGASELLMPALTPIELFKDTGRADAYGDLLFKVTDRHGRVAALGPTHEEVITSLMMNAVTSYKQLPLNLYQIQTKFRDEFRPRSGLLRGREFIMKDAYSFSLTIDGPGGLNEMYDAMYKAYVNIFTRCGLDFTVVEAESGPIGGSASHEFMVNAESGEDTILRCPVSGYAANVEKCEIGERAWSWAGAATQELKKVHTPGMPGIEGVAQHLGVTPSQMLKTIVFKVTGGSALRAEGGSALRADTSGSGAATEDSARRAEPPEWILAVVRGDHEVNEGKVKAASGCSVVLAPDKEARAAGFAIGYVSPKSATDPRFGVGSEALCKVRVLVDQDAAQANVSWATGADEPDHHVTGFNWRRDMGAALDDANLIQVIDLRNAQAGDPSPRSAGAKLETGRGIEVGHIFKLGTKYSDAMGLAVLDEKQERRSVIMGCYGIGVSRTMQACVEMSHDENGIVWPMAIAPYNVLIVLLDPGEAEHIAAAESIAGELAATGLDVLIDDRAERPGVKFKDADLIGIPIRLTIGKKSLEAGGAEFKLRTDTGKGEVVPVGAVAQRCLGAA